MIAWAFSREGYKVDLYEQNALISATSRASSKMLHGGIRYLEQGHFRLVKEALQERAWWLKQAPSLAHQVELLLPVYRGVGRSRWVVRLGTALYNWLAKGSGFSVGRWYKAKEVLSELPDLKSEGLIGAYSYWDGQMDDYKLGMWASVQAKNSGVSICEGLKVTNVDPELGCFNVAGQTKEFDLIVNATGPWAKQLLNQSAIESEYALDLVQGTHILVRGELRKGCVLQVAKEKRILFTLPYQGKTLIGTTERKIANPEDCGIAEAEVNYLLKTYNRYFVSQLKRDDVLEAFCGVRPIVASKKNFSRASRESVLEKNGKLINVFGGKWTTSRSLAKSVLFLARKKI